MIATIITEDASDKPGRDSELSITTVPGGGWRGTFSLLIETMLTTAIDDVPIDVIVYANSGRRYEGQVAEVSRLNHSDNDRLAFVDGASVDFGSISSIHI